MYDEMDEIKHKTKAIIRTCRACLNNYSGKGIQLDEDDWFEIYYFCINSEITNKAMVQATTLCMNCSQLLKKYAHFKKKCLLSEALWRTILTQDLIVSIVKTDPVINAPLESSDNGASSEQKSLEEKSDELKTEIKKENEITDDKLSTRYSDDDDDNNEENNIFMNCDKVVSSFKGICNKCGKTFDVKLHLENHIQSCENQTYRESILKRQKTSCKKKIKERKFCGLCEAPGSGSGSAPGSGSGSASAAEWDEEEHLRLHYQRMDLECQLCDFVGLDFAQMISHRYDHGPGGRRRRRCFLCGTAARRRRDLETHFRRRHEAAVTQAQPPYRCNDCGLRCADVDQLRTHVRRQHQAPRYVCHYCGQLYRRHHFLQIHILNMHTRHVPVRCDHCDKLFKSKDHLQKHQNDIIRVKPFSCPHCSKKFTTETIMSRHLIWHSSVRNHKCTYCDKAFKSKSNLRSHMNLHLGIHRYKCSVCESTFASSTQLKRHASDHSGVKQHRCDYCGVSYHLRQLLQKHRLKRHANDIKITQF